MFCTKCGKEFQEGASFCTNCGAPRPKLEAPAPIPFDPVEPEPEAPAPAPQEPAPAPVIQPTAPAVRPAPPSPPPIDLEPSEPPKEKKGKGGLIALVILLLLVVGAAVCFLLNRVGILSIPSLSGGGGQDAPYQDTIDVADLIAGPDSFDGERIGVNAEVEEVDGKITLTALLSDGKEELEAVLAISEEDLTVFSEGDAIYIDGVFHTDGFPSFGPAIVTLTEGRDKGTSVRTISAPAQEDPDEPAESEGASAPEEEPEEEWTSVTDYNPYMGAFSAAATQEEFVNYGGPVVVLSSERSSLLYEIYNYDTDGTRAVLTGAAPMDGSTEIDFYGGDGMDNTVSGTLYLLEDGNVALDARVVDDGGAGWGLETGGYVPLTPCTFTDYLNAPPAPYNEQELRVTTSGPYATVALYNWKDGGWEEKMSFQATIGANGITSAKAEGDKCTPAGTYDILFAFSTLDIFSGIPYERIEDGDVWVTDPNSAYYNTLQSVYNANADWSEAEDLYAKFTSGRSTACIYFAFNGDGVSPYSAVSGGGSDLFLDGVGTEGNLATGYGDIKTDGQNVLDLLHELNGNKHPVIVIQ